MTSTLAVWGAAFSADRALGVEAAAVLGASFWAFGWSLASFSAGLKNLEYLRCNKTRIKNIEPLRELSDLRELSIASTPLESIDALEGLANLEELSLSNTLITTIGPIMHLQQLEKIEISTGMIPEEEIERFIELHPHCEVVLKP